MARYVSQPARLWVQDMPDDYPATQQVALTVMDAPPRDTGILDASGRKIMKLPEPIGFPVTR